MSEVGESEVWGLKCQKFEIGGPKSECFFKGEISLAN